MAKLPAVYVFNKRQLGILSPEKILYPFYLNIRDWLCFFEDNHEPVTADFSVWNWFIVGTEAENWVWSWGAGTYQEDCDTEVLVTSSGIELSLCSSLLPPSLTIKTCIKDSYGTYSVFWAHCNPSDALSFLPSAPFPSRVSPTPPHIGKFRLIRIRRANPPPHLLFPLRINVLTLGKKNNRQSKCPLCCCFGSWSLFPVFLNLDPFYFPLVEADAFLSSPSSYKFFSIFYVFSLPWALISHYKIRHPYTYAPLTTFGFVSH